MKNHYLKSALLLMLTWAGFCTPTHAQNNTYNRALNFDGVNDRVNCVGGISPVQNHLTATARIGMYEMWIKPASFTNQALISIENLTAANALLNSFVFGIDANGFLKITLFNSAPGNPLAGAPVFTATTALTLNTWQHVAVTTFGTNTTLLINGVNVGTTTTATFVADAVGAFNLSGSTQRQSIGAGPAHNTFNGEIDEVRIWNTGFTVAQIGTNKDIEPANNATNLTGYYKFNQGGTHWDNTAITTVNNSIVAGVNGTPTNFTLTGTTSNFAEGYKSYAPVTSVAGCNGGSAAIAEVTFAGFGLGNNSGFSCSASNGSNGVRPASSVTNYGGRYTPQSMQVGASVTLQITPTGAGSNVQYYSVFLDNNGDYDFSDAGELVGSGNGTGVSTVIIPFTAPATAGRTMMRIIASNTAAATATQSAGIPTGQGEVEEYFIRVSPTLCPGPLNITPVSGTTIGGIVGSPIAAINFGVNLANLEFSASGLPAGLVLSANGILSGTPTVAGIGNISIFMTNTTTGCQGSAVYPYNFTTCASSTITITPANTVLPGYVIGSGTYTQNITASGIAGATYTYAITSGALPSVGSFTLSSAGVLSGFSGTPFGVNTFTVTATSVPGGCTSTKTYTFASCGTATVSSNAPSSGNVNYTVNTPITNITFSTTPTDSYTYALSSGSSPLPTGLSLSTAGVISGTPTSGIGSTVAVVATNTVTGCNYSATNSITFVACPTITISPTGAALPSATTGAAYSQTLTASGIAGATYTYAVTSGAFPAGITMSSAGVISGTTALGGFVTVGITATSNGGCVSAVKSYTLNICPGSISVSPTTIPPIWTVGTAIPNITYTATPAGTYTFTATGLPMNVVMSNAGVLSGTPTVAGTGSYTVTATNGSNCTGSRVYTYDVIASCPTITVNPTASALTYTVNTVIPSINLSGSGGVAPYTYTIAAGSLPLGVSFAGSTISGTPLTSGTGTFTIRATDANACNGITVYTYTVNSAGCPTIAVNPTTSAFTYTASTAIASINLSALGGATPYTYAISGGALPAGVNIAGSTISGTPTTTGNGTFTVRATDANGCTGTTTYTFTVNAAGTPVPPVVVPSNPTTSIDNSLESSVKISPNPSKGDVNIDFNGLNAGKASVCVYDMQGKPVFSSEINTNKAKISLEKLANGMYLIEITTNKGRIIKRIAKTN